MAKVLARRDKVVKYCLRPGEVVVRLSSMEKLLLRRLLRLLMSFHRVVAHPADSKNKHEGYLVNTLFR